MGARGSIFALLMAAALLSDLVDLTDWAAWVHAQERAEAPLEVQRVTGTVVRVSTERIVVRVGERQYRFDLTDQELGEMASAKGLMPGDTVTVWYALDAKGLKIHPVRHRSGPGDRAGKKGAATPGSSEVPGSGIIIDDRAYYPARLEGGEAEEGASGVAGPAARSERVRKRG